MKEILWRTSTWFYVFAVINIVTNMTMSPHNVIFQTGTVVAAFGFLILAKLYRNSEKEDEKRAQSAAVFTEILNRIADLTEDQKEELFRPTDVGVATGTVESAMHQSETWDRR